MVRLLLEELDSCQVRDMYYIHLLLWLSWFVLGAPFHVSRPEDYWTSLRPSAVKVQRDHSVWCVELLEELLFPLQMIEVSETRRPESHQLCWEESLGLFSQPPGCRFYPVFRYFSHTQLSLLPSLPPASTWDTFLLLFTSSSLKRRTCISSQKPSQLLQDSVTKPSFLSPGPPYCYSALALTILSYICRFVLFSPSEQPLEGRNWILSVYPAWYTEAQNMLAQVTVLACDSNS